MYWTIMFHIANRQWEYAKCLQMVEYLLDKKENNIIEDADFLKCVNYLYSDKRMTFEKIGKSNLQNCSTKIPQIMPGDEVKYVFYVDCSYENDIVNIIYYCLANDRLDGKSILCVKSNNQQKISANMKDLLSNLIFEEKIKECYFLEKQIYIRAEVNKNRLIRRFSPIYYIGENENTVEYWRQSVQSFLLKLYKDRRIPIGNEEYEYTKNYFLPHISPSILKDGHREDIKINLKDLDVRLMSIFSECFCTKENPTKGFAEKRYEIWKSKELFERVKDIPLLAMYIFCIFDYFLKNRDTDSMEQIEQEIFDARDMADGLIQILENVYHSENRRGYFCFRVHNDRDGRSKDYLDEQYYDYITQGKRREMRQPVNYLEIKVADCSHCTIPNRFYEGFVKKMEDAENGEKQIYQDIQEEARKLTVSSFFNNTENSDFWHKYNAMSENVVHHYGLQVFESLVFCYEGYFRVRSQENYELQWEEESWSSINGEITSLPPIGIPGTQYDILVPFRGQRVMQNTSLNVNINYTNYLLKKFSVCETISFKAINCIAVFNGIKQRRQGMTYQEIKQETIQELHGQLKKSINLKAAEDMILHFSADNISLTMVEMFCKTIMLYIAQKLPKSNCYIMITECTQSHFVEITRMMALFYNKQGVNSLMKGTQIFMSGQKEGEEFLISGTNLGEAIGSTEKLAFARCIHPDCLKILKKMLKNHSMGIVPNEAVSIVPFDMIKYNDGKPTLFEQSLLKILNQDVQSEKFGCKLENLHVRIGSKIHVRSFYEAELLFHNNYYTSRFAYWLFNELNNNPDFDIQKPFVLVGYENYSEMLLSELCNMFQQAGVKTDYLVYEQKTVGRFRGNGSFGQYKDSQVVIIVPINSTMTTHIKTSGFLEKTIKEALGTEKEKDYEKYQLGMVFNYGIVLISDSRENQYWEKSGEEENTIMSRINGGKMKFYVEVDAKWEHPLKCEACFPEVHYTKELPLVETNKESVVPMHAIGIKREAKKMARKSYGITAPETAKLRELSNFLVYDHVERNGNHFSYYFSTEKLWDFPDVRKNVQSWLISQKSLFPAEQCKVYDIIVAPLHFSNTAFVEEVNGYLFSNAALVLHFDVNREFRMNIKTKFSSVQQLYDNLCMDDDKSIINFHYVDDTIISGHTFSRMKSLIGSLIDVREGSSVTINIFKSIVVLLNRMSDLSKKYYIEDTRYYMAYFNLNISSMRVNSDACILCKKYDEWNKLAEQASLNETYGYWKRKSNNIKYKPIEKLRWEKEKKDSKRQARAKQYMIASHKAKSLMDILCDYADKAVIEQEIAERLFPRDMKRGLEELIAMLKVLGRPFMTFRKEEKEAVFELMLLMLDKLIQDTEPKEEGKLYDILRQLWKNTGNRTKIITMLVNRLAELESNYIIRKRSMNQIIEYCMKNITDEKERKTFEDNYLNRIKQLVGQSNDFAKGLYLEYLLLYNEEYQDDFAKREIISLAGKDGYAVFKKKVYLENTKLADYGIEYLADCFADGMECTEDNLRNALNDNYYFDNFIQYMAFHKMVNIDEQGEIINFCSENDVKKLEGMVRFQLLYQMIFQERKTSYTYVEEEKSVEELKNKFAEMLRYLQAASGSTDGEIIVPYKNQKEQAEKYIALELGVSSEIQRMENKERNLLEFMKENACFEGDTYAVCSWDEKQKWILLKFYDAISIGSDNIPAIYMLFPFSNANEGEMLHALKNILIFRDKIWKILNLSSSTLLQNWTDSLFYKQQMLKSRAVGHTEIESLVKGFEIVTNLICDEKYQEKDISTQNLYRAHFELLINSMIGYMNSRVLGDKGKDFMSVSEMNFKQFWDGDKKCFDAACAIWKLKIEFKNKGKLMGRSLRKGTEQSDKIPDPDMLRTLFLAIFQNAEKHGVKTKDGDKKTITISMEGDNLCISNHVNKEKKEQIEREIASEAYRSGEGISQAVIFDTCQSWYQDVKYDKMFALKEDKKSSGKEWLYVVKLPIMERVDGK